MIQSVPDARRARALTVRTLARAAAVTAIALALLTAVLAVLGRDVQRSWCRAHCHSGSRCSG